MEVDHKDDYASKGIAGTGLGLGIAGTALGLLNGNLGNLFCNGNYAQQKYVSHDELVLNQEIAN